RGLQHAGFTSTIVPELIQYHLFEADRLRAVLKLRESIGQLLSYTDEDSGRRAQEQFAKHHENLAVADVIHVFVSCPTDDRPESLERLQNDLALLMPNLRAVLACRPPGRQAAVAVVVSKPDPAFPTADDARAALTDERLRGMLHRLVLLLEGSDRVGLAAVFVVSAFGYGKARRLDGGGAAGGAPAKGFSLLSQGEAEWVLKEGEAPAPHNLTALVWWTLMAGLALKPADRRGPELARTAKLLLDDIKATGGWYLPLNCRPVG
ncbi:MAG: hypothetical protein K2V38_13225, partial [Gemmataceae bacterium]|nr:hypothetical protein [Gemmataceae bacterium]